MAEPTRQPSTEEAYRRAARRVIRDFLATHPDAELPNRETRMLLAAWLSAHARDRRWSRATWRQIRAALICAIRDAMGDDEARWTLGEINRADREATAAGEAIPSRSLRTTKARAVPETDLRRILMQLAGRDSAYATLTANWLRANLHTGLRPIEWMTATINHEARTLTVDNAKSTNGRAHGINRTLRLDALTDQQWGEIVRFLTDLQSLTAAHPFDIVYARARTMLSRAKYALRRAGIDVGNVTLYSTRHQFTANLRASGRSPREVATLLGHADTASARKHYGTRAQGTAGNVAAATQSEMDRVKLSSHGMSFRTESNGSAGHDTENHEKTGD